MRETASCPTCGRDDSNILSEVVCPGCGTPRPGTRDHRGADPPARPTVLCIDDDPLVLHFFRGFLELHSYRVLTAREGLDGLALAQREHPDVILLDVMLRGLSGFDICRKFRAEPTLRTTPIVLLTVWDHPSLQTTGDAVGATLTLRKPADRETILTALAQVLRDRSDPPRESW